MVWLQERPPQRVKMILLFQLLLSKLCAARGYRRALDLLSKTCRGLCVRISIDRWLYSLHDWC